MASSGNFPVLNILYKGQRGTSASYYPTIIQGNTKLRSTDNQDALQITTFEGLKSGKWYWEWSLISPGGDRLVHSGAADSNRINWDYTSSSAVYGAEESIHFHTYNQIMKKDGSDTGAYSSSASSHADDDVFGFALDVDNGKAYIHKNGTYYASGNPATGSNPGATWTTASEYTDGFTPYFSCAGGTNADGVINFGQDSTFGGRITAGGNADGNGFGDFKYSPPTGFLAVCSANLPISDDIDPAQTDDDYPSKQFDTVLYTGNASTNNITGLNFQPDLVWIKIRNTASNAVLVDSSRGTNKMLHPNNTDAEATTANLTSFNSDGFSLDGTSNYQANYNGNGNTYVAWCWKANGGTTSTNDSGSVDSTVQANTKTGFSIVQTPNYSSSATFGHGLSSAPEFILARLTGGSSWAVYHNGIGDSGKILYLNTDAAAITNAAFNSTAPTSSVFSLGAPFGGSGAGIVYCWHSVEGFSKFGSYKGNGNDDGAFIYTGFRPRMVFCKNIGASEAWVVADTARETENPVDKILKWNNTNVEATGSTYAIDIVSNGFKARTSWEGWNQSGNTIIYGAWGDVPFKYNNTF